MDFGHINLKAFQKRPKTIESFKRSLHKISEKIDFCPIN
jgi:hypothetical protein